MSKTERAYVGGTFDLFHWGHVRFFAQVRARFGYVIASLNTDEFATRYKRRPVLSLTERLTMIEACRYVDEVTINDGNEDSSIAITRVKPTVIVHGDDWQGESYVRQLGLTPEFLQAQGIRLEYVPYTQGISTSELLARIRGEHGNDL